MKTLVEKFAFDTTARPPIYCEQLFQVENKELIHTIDGTVRAIVPELGVADYLDSVNVSQALTDQEKLNVLEAFTDL